jgi:Gram-negative bacterial TonB protein C-terminal
MAMRTKMITAIVILTLACPAGSWGQQIQPSQQAGEARAPREAVSQRPTSVVTLVAIDASGRQEIIEYGFFVDPWTIVTGYPPFKEAVDNGKQISVIGVNSGAYPANQIAVDKDRRLLFIDVEIRAPLSLPLGKPGKIKTGDKIFLPAVKIAAGSPSPEAGDFIEMTTPVPPGYAGLPALDQSGNVIGVVVDQRFKSTPASGVIPVKELTGKLDVYFSGGNDPDKKPAKKPSGAEPGSNRTAEGPAAEREAGGQVAFQSVEATRTTSEIPLDRVESTVRPRALKVVKASYTPAARAALVSGTVVVSVLIDERGEISQAKAVSGHELLILPALKAARQCLFAPTLRYGVPVKVRTTLEFPFYIY